MGKRRKYDTVLISAEDEGQAKDILRPLLELKLVIGGVITENPAMFWWKDEIVEMPYVFAKVFARSTNRERIMEVVRKHTKETVPIVTFTEIQEGTKEFRDWVDTYTKTE